MAVAEPVVTELTIDGSGAERGQGQYVRAMDAAKAAMEKAIATNARLIEAQDQQARASGLVAAANDNLARSYGAANDNVKAAGDGFRSTIIEVASMTNHLKFAALAAYAYSPAFRALVNPAITATIATLGPAAVSAGAAVIRALTPALAFLARITLPILAIIAAWEALNAIVNKGSDLLEKYGNAGRSLDSSSLVANLEKLTKLQPKDDGVTAAQARDAAELNTRLDQAKFKLGEALKAQFDLNDAALGLQRIWVNIVEKIAEYAEKASNLGPPDPGLEELIKNTGYQATGKGDIDDRFAAIRDARRKLSAGLGMMAKDENDPLGSTFAARFNANIDALANKAPKAAEEVKKVASQFDTLYASMSRTAAVQEAEAKAVDASVGEHARLRAEMRLQESAQQEITERGKGQLSDYAERIKTLADRFAAAAQMAAELKLKSDIKFTSDTLLFSDTDKHIASILRQTYGAEWKNMMNGPLAGAMRFNAALKDIVDTTREIGGEILKSVVHALMEGKNVGEALSATLKNLSARLADKSIEALLSGDFAKAAISGISAAVTFIGSKLLDNSQDKALQEAKLKFAGMTDEVNNFNAAAAGFDLSPFVSAIQQIKSTALDLIKAAMAAGDTASAIQLIFSAVKGINNQVDQFIKPKGTDTASQIANVNAQAQQLIDELNDLNARYHLGLNRTNDILAGAAAQIEDILKKAQAEIDKRKLGFQDRLFNETNDSTTLEGQLLAFDRQAQKDLQAERDAGGQALIDLEAAQQAERFNVIKSFNDKATAATQQAVQAQLDAQTRAAKGIVDYINNLKVGPDSSLSPTDKLAAAQSTYNSILALAQGGNVDALGRISQDAENFRKAARDVYASAAPYQNILNTIIAQLQGLPAVATSSDPIVQAVLGTTAAVQQTRDAVLTDTASTVARLDTAVARLADTVTQLAAVVNREDTANTFLTSMNSFTSRIVEAINRHGELMATIGNDAHSVLVGIKLGTDYTANHSTLASGPYVGTFGGGAGFQFSRAATGGWIYGAGGPTDDRAGLYALSNGEAVIPAASAAANRSIVNDLLAGRSPSNDNGIRQELSDIKRILAAVGAAIVNAEMKTGAEVAGAIVAALNEQTNSMKSDERQTRTNPKNRREAA